MSKISPCLWFDGQAEEAAALYTSLFPNSRIERVNRSPGETPSGPEGMRPDRRLHSRWRAVHRTQRRTGLPVQRGHLFQHRLRGPGRGRPLLGRADRGRRRAERLRLAEGPVRRLLAGRPKSAARVLERGRSRSCEACPGRDAQDDQAGRGDVARGVRGRPRLIKSYAKARPRQRQRPRPSNS